MPPRTNVHDKSEVAPDETAGPSETVPERMGIADRTSFLHTTESPFDQEPSRILEGILQDAASSRDYRRARKEAFDLIEEHGLHHAREQVFKMLDQFEAGVDIDPSSAGDKGKGRDVGERPKRQHEELDNNEPGPKRRRKNTGRDRKSSGSDDGSSESEGDGLKLTFSWTSQPDQYARHRNYQNLPLANQMNEIREYHIRHKKKALEDLKSQISKPSFPMSLWEAVLLNQYSTSIKSIQFKKGIPSMKRPFINPVSSSLCSTRLNRNGPSMTREDGHPLSNAMQMLSPLPSHIWLPSCKHTDDILGSSSQRSDNITAALSSSSIRNSGKNLPEMHDSCSMMLNQANHVSMDLSCQEMHREGLAEEKNGMAAVQKYAGNSTVVSHTQTAGSNMSATSASVSTGGLCVRQEKRRREERVNEWKMRPEIPTRFYLGK